MAGVLGNRLLEIQPTKTPLTLQTADQTCSADTYPSHQKTFSGTEHSIDTLNKPYTIQHRPVVDGSASAGHESKPLNIINHNSNVSASDPSQQFKRNGVAPGSISRISEHQDIPKDAIVIKGQMKISKDSNVVKRIPVTNFTNTQMAVEPNKLTGQNPCKVYVLQPQHSMLNTNSSSVKLKVLAQSISEKADKAVAASNQILVQNLQDKKEFGVHVLDGKKIVSQIDGKVAVKVLSSQPPNQLQVKTVPTVKPAESIEAVSELDIKEGHAYLRPMAKFLYKIGLDLVRDVVIDDLVQQYSTGTLQYTKEQFDLLQKTINCNKELNKEFKLKNDKKCRFLVDGYPCSFRTHSTLVMERHKSQAHVNRSNRMLCCRCDFSTVSASHFRDHVRYSHGCAAEIVKPPSFFPCKLCFFEHNKSGKLASHSERCVKNFNLEKNLMPDAMANTPLDENIMKPKPSQQSNSHQTQSQRIIHPKSQTKSPGPAQLTSGASASPVAIVSRNSPLVAKTSQNPVPNKAILGIPASNGVSSSPALSQSITQIGGKAANQMDICQCEICNGYIAGSQALKVHMQWCHNINITHLKSAVLKCTTEGCTTDFWTIGGLAKHTLSYHKVQTDDVANHNYGVKCFVCEKSFTGPLVQHFLSSHLQDLKTMVETKKCLSSSCMTRSGALTFDVVEGLQTHLTTVHKLLFIGLAALSSSNVNSVKFQPYCSICKQKFVTSKEFADHCAKEHVHRCDICGAQSSTAEGVKEHSAKAHKMRYCLACDQERIKNGYIQHLKVFHKAFDCKLLLKRLSDTEFETYKKKPRLDGWWNSDVESS